MRLVSCIAVALALLAIGPADAARGVASQDDPEPRAAPAAPPQWLCTASGPVDAERVPPRVANTPSCDLVGKRFSDEGVQLSVPPRGTGVAAYAVEETGYAAFDILHDRNGVIHFREVGDASLDGLLQSAAAALGACKDDTRSDRDRKESDLQRWHLHKASRPSNISSSAAVAAVRDGYDNIPQVNNNCRMSDNVNASQKYEGGSDGRHPEMDASGCDASWTTDGHNVVGWRDLPSGKVGLNCHTYVPKPGPDEITHSDIGLSKNHKWTNSPGSSSCSNRYDIRSVMTHEAGHAFGLGHAPGAPNLTMYWQIEPCKSKLRTLGKGDVNSLRTLY